jgi:type II secretory pathway pseudopilin PulG
VSLRNLPRPRLRDESGLTLIEVMITLLVSLIIIAASAQFFVLANGSSNAGRRQVNLLALAQAQIEQVRQTVKHYGFGSLGLTSIPAKAGADTSPSDPTDFIDSTGTKWEVEENYDVPGTILTTEPLVTGGMIAAKQTNVAAGSATATVWTFVSQVPDVCGLTSSLCSGGATTSANTDVRRVVVAVKLNNTSGVHNAGPNNPQYLTTIITNPVPSDQVNAVDGLRIGLNVS